MKREQGINRRSFLQGAAASVAGGLTAAAAPALGRTAVGGVFGFSRNGIFGEVGPEFVLPVRKVALTVDGRSVVANPGSFLFRVFAGTGEVFVSTRDADADAEQEEESL